MVDLSSKTVAAVLVEVVVVVVVKHQLNQPGVRQFKVSRFSCQHGGKDQLMTEKVHAIIIVSNANILTERHCKICIIMEHCELGGIIVDISEHQLYDKCHRPSSCLIRALRIRSFSIKYKVAINFFVTLPKSVNVSPFTGYHYNGELCEFSALNNFVL